ncbi:hypothetical protein [Anaerobranca gottschalkii]|uniref:hypothetical protein n=1 Tax=Anaerobranca gottschalkii TaxID=108328 RepID=UPI000B810D67|nr:hypothetical protein [Anaerobranca gottschalkii]
MNKVTFFELLAINNIIILSIIPIVIAPNKSNLFDFGTSLKLILLLESESLKNNNPITIVKIEKIGLKFLLREKEELNKPIPKNIKPKIS